MSDEPTPPPLRLKPRVRLDPESPAEPTGPNPPPAAPVPAPPASAEGPEPSAPRLRLKPRLAPPPTDAPETQSSPTPAAEPPPPTPSNPPAPTEPASDLSQKFKLKPPAAESPATPPIPALIPPPVVGEAPSPAEPVPTKAPAPLPFPVVVPAEAPKKPAPPTPHVPHVRAPSNLAEEVPAPKPTGASNSRRTRQLALLAIAILAAAFVAYRYLVGNAAPPAAPPTAKTATPPAPAGAKPGPTPSETLNKIAAAPGVAIGKAQDAVTARRTIEQDRVNALAEGKEPSGARALNTPPPSTFAGPGTKTPAAPQPTATAQLAPGVTATTTVTQEVAGSGSLAFRTWVGSARINGVFQGSPARALINGRTVRAGQTVDEALGIVFERLDAEARTIVFRDASGATIARKY